MVVWGGHTVWCVSGVRSAPAPRHVLPLWLCAPDCRGGGNALAHEDELMSCQPDIL